MFSHVLTWWFRGFWIVAVQKDKSLISTGCSPTQPSETTTDSTDFVLGKYVTQ